MHRASIYGDTINKQFKMVAYYCEFYLVPMVCGLHRPEHDKPPSSVGSNLVVEIGEQYLYF